MIIKSLLASVTISAIAALLVFVLPGAFGAKGQSQSVAKPLTRMALTTHVGDLASVPNQCPIYTYDPGCQVPPNGIVVPVTSGPQAGGYVTLPAKESTDAGGDIVVKLSVGNNDINDQQQQVLIGQLLVNGLPVASAPMSSTWHYTGGVYTCSSVQDRSGLAECAEPAIAFRSRDGMPVQITVNFTYQAHLYSSAISYTPYND